jgi:sugar-specific transcriptional regulator TrmB
MKDLEEKMSYLGLNKKQAKAYIFILKNKRVYLRDLANYLDVTIAGVSKLLKGMIRLGYVKTFQIGNKKVFMSVDIAELRKNFMKRKKAELNQYNAIFDELESGYGEYTIKVFRITSSKLMESVEQFILNSEGPIYEFVDIRNAVKKSMPSAYKNIQFISVYFDEKCKIRSRVNGKYFFDVSRNYSHILAFDDKVICSTLNKETILIENEEISNSIKYLISTTYLKVSHLED